MKAATPWTTDEGLIAPHALLVQALVAQLRVTLQALADCDTAIPPSPSCKPSQARGLSAPPAFAWPVAHNAHARLPLPHGKKMRVWRRSPHAAGKSLGGTGAFRVPSAAATRVWSGRRRRSGMPAGPRSTLSSNAPRAKPSKRPYGPWRSHGSASSLGVGRTAPRMRSLSLSQC
jgi:hypothetical protein